MAADIESGNAGHERSASMVAGVGPHGSTAPFKSNIAFRKTFGSRCKEEFRTFIAGNERGALHGKAEEELRTSRMWVAFRSFQSTPVFKSVEHRASLLFNGTSSLLGGIDVVFKV